MQNGWKQEEQKNQQICACSVCKKQKQNQKNKHSAWGFLNADMSKSPNCGAQRNMWSTEEHREIEEGA